MKRQRNSEIEEEIKQVKEGKGVTRGGRRKERGRREKKYDTKKDEK